MGKLAALFLTYSFLSLYNSPEHEVFGMGTQEDGSVLFGDTLGKITDWWQWHPCLLVFSLFHLKNIYLTQVLTRPCAGG